MAAMRDIVAAAEMQAASVYHYFESKEELLWAVWEKGGLELLHRVAATRRIPGNAWNPHTTGLLDWRRANQALFIMPPPREHQGKGHRTAGRIRKDLHRPDRRPSPAQGRRSPLSASGSHPSALLVAGLVQEGARPPRP